MAPSYSTETADQLLAVMNMIVTDEKSLFLGS